MYFIKTLKHFIKCRRWPSKMIPVGAGLMGGPFVRPQNTLKSNRQTIILRNHLDMVNFLGSAKSCMEFNRKCQDYSSPRLTRPNIYTLKLINEPPRKSKAQNQRLLPRSNFPDLTQFHINIRNSILINLHFQKSTDSN